MSLVVTFAQTYTRNHHGTQPHGTPKRTFARTHIERLDSARERDLFYVGATRATQRLIVLANESLRARLRLSSGSS